jgi:cobalt-zinc-cadmium efflux system outer membrane protein
MKMYRKYLLLFFLFLGYRADYAQQLQDQAFSSNSAVTLEELISRLDRNPALGSFDDKIQSYKEYSRAATSWSAPKITAGFWMTPYNTITGKNEAGAGQNNGSLMIAVEQMIPNPSIQRSEQKYMEGMSSVDRQMKNYERQEMIAMVKKNFYDWLILKKKLKVLEQNESVISLMIKSAEIGYTYNQTALNRIYKAQAELYNIQNMQLMARNDIRQMNVEINTLTYGDKEALYDIDTNYSILNYDLIPVDTIIPASKSNVRSIEQSIRLLDLKRNLEQSKRKPEFGVQYAHMNSFGSMPNQFNLMGMMTIPIAPWADKAYKANIKGIKYETSSLSKKKASLINETAGKLEKIKADISSKKKQAAMYEHYLIPALEKNFHTSLIAFEHMKEDMSMTLDALAALKMARLEYLNLLGQLLKSQAEYERENEM